MSERVYLDYAATTPVDPRVLERMLPYFTGTFGNPSSVHWYGQQAEASLESARESVAAALGARANEIVFTSCGTESDNLAIRGMAFTRRDQTGAQRILTTPIEHHAVLHTVEQLAELHGFTAELLPVDSYGRVDPEDLRHALREDVALVSIMYANNEIGTINPMAEIGQLCSTHGVPLHSDAVQAAAHLPMDVSRDKIDLLAIGAHKFYGPKGVGALAIRKGIQLHPSQTGGGQEDGRRAGTQNIPYIVGLAEALKLTVAEMPNRNARYIHNRDRLIAGVLENVPGSRLTGHPTERLPNHASFAFENLDGNHLLTLLDAAGFACSSGSACKVGDPKPSEVLKAIGLAPAWTLGSLRVTLGATTTTDDIDAFVAILPDLARKVRSHS
ncbi:MAG TPA: cysteine desulfurase family protein [Bellilinea sp.]|nr:cysteine desulfurase family protein [Bellilinea sp.]